MLIYGTTAGSDTYMDKNYKVETFKTNSKGGTYILSFDNLLVNKNPQIQKSLNGLAPLTSAENPLYLTWSSGNLYGIINDTAYLLYHGENGRWLLSLPDIYDAKHEATVVALGPITQEDYKITPASPS